MNIIIISIPRCTLNLPPPWPVYSCPSLGTYFHVILSFPVRHLLPLRSSYILLSPSAVPCSSFFSYFYVLCKTQNRAPSVSSVQQCSRNGNPFFCQPLFCSHSAPPQFLLPGLHSLNHPLSQTMMLLLSLHSNPKQIYTTLFPSRQTPPPSSSAARRVSNAPSPK